MTEKLKAFCERELRLVETRGSNVRGTVTYCHGAMMFVANELLDGEEGEKLRKWWVDEMFPRFRKLY